MLARNCRSISLFLCTALVTSLSLFACGDDGAPANSDASPTPDARQSDAMVIAPDAGPPAGRLDEGFGVNGIVTLNDVLAAGADDTAAAVIVDSANNIVVGGSAHNGTDFDGVIWRFDNAGAVDTNFGTSGRVVHGGLRDQQLSSVLIDGTSILAVGVSSINGRPDVLVVRHDNSGGPDEAIGTGGARLYNGVIPGCAAFDIGAAGALDSNDKLIVTGSATEPDCGEGDFFLFRANASTGEFDTSFATTGVVRDQPIGDYTADQRHDWGLGIAFDSANNILVSGYSVLADDTSSADAAIWRVTGAGALDTSFGDSSRGTAVYTSIAGGNLSDLANALALDSSDRAIVAGTSANAAGNRDIVLWRMLADGSGVDTTFGTNGYVIYDGTGGDDGSASVAIDSVGRILVAANRHNGTDTDIAVLRFDSNGALDASFADNGVLIYDGGNGDDVAGAMVLDAAGKIVVVGNQTNAAGDKEMLVMRLNP